MPNPPPPIVPNFQPGVGRLATDRYDFEAHITGANYRHQANQIDLFPTVVIGGDGYTNVQTAIQALAFNLAPPIPNATTTQLGIIQLGGDLGGTSTSATTPKVSGLQGRPVSTLSPTPNQFLQWNGSAWTPTTFSVTFANDLAGTDSSQTVVGITGTAGTVNVTANTFQFSTTSVPEIFQLPLTVDSPPQNITISTQAPYSGASAGLNRIAGSLVVDMTTPWPLGFYGSIYEPAFEIRRVNDETSSLTDTTQGVFAAANLFTGSSAIWIGINALPPTTIVGGVNYQGALNAPAVSVPNTLGRTPTNYSLATDNSFNLYLNTAVTDNTGAVIMQNMSHQLLTVAADSGTYTTTNVNAPSGNLNLSSTSGTVDIFKNGNAVVCSYNNWVASPGYALNTQMQLVQNYSYVFTTVSSSHQQVTPTFTLANGKSCTVEARWIRRNSTGGGGYWGGFNAFVCNASGGSIAAPQSAVYANGGTGLNTEILVFSSGNSFWLTAEPPSSTSFDWELFVTLFFC
jgi:hypothetical protein